MDVWHWQNCVSNAPELFSDTNERPIEFRIQDTEKTIEQCSLWTYKSIDLTDDIGIMQCKACWTQSITSLGRFLWFFTVCIVLGWQLSVNDKYSTGNNHNIFKI